MWDQKFGTYVSILATVYFLLIIGDEVPKFKKIKKDPTCPQ